MINLISLLPADKDITFFYDKPVIMIPNEWRNPVIGFVNEVRDGNLVIHDYVTDSEFVGCYRTFIFTAQRYQLVLKLDPFEICSLIYPEECLEDAFIKEKNTYLLSSEDINARLRDNEFWRDLREYNDELKAAA